MGESCCPTTLNLADLQAGQRRVLVVVLAINLLTFVMMITASYVSGSSSLLSGALDNFGDALTYVFSLAVIGATNVAKAKVALFKGLMITAAALAVAFQIGWRVFHPEVPVFETMGIAALLNLGANLFCLRLLTPYRHADVNMSSAWECSRNDVTEGLAVIVATVAVWIFQSGWPDIIVAAGLLLVFSRSAVRVLQTARRELDASQPAT